MAKWLFLDCARETAVAAIGDGESILALRQWGSRQAAETTTLEIDHVFSEAGLQPCDLEGLAWASGPGSFTGLKVAAATIQALAWIWEKPVASVPHLAALAYSLREQRPVSILACRKTQPDLVFWCPYVIRPGQWPEGKVQVTSPHEIQLPPGRWRGVGDSLQSLIHPDLEDRLGDWIHEPGSPVQSSLALAELARKEGRLERPEEVQPLYVGQSGKIL
jgi:tRNA threonylcarbamoyladenosine biosynthesis protein TsaB